MTTQLPIRLNPELDLVLERVVDVPKELVWKAWTVPEHLMRWFTPAPWKTVECTIDLRPGGLFYTVMQSPEGEKFPGSGCYLEVVENQKLIWTDAMIQDYRPAAQPNDCINSFFTAMLFLESQGTGTKYTAIALHNSLENRKNHEEKGFHDGWGKALDQLVDNIKQGYIQ